MKSFFATAPPSFAFLIPRSFLFSNDRLSPGVRRMPTTSD